MPSWGGVAGHLQVGIEVRTDGYDTNTPSINVYIDFYVQSVAWGFNDPQTLTSYVNGAQRDTFSYHMSSGTGQTVAKYVGTTLVPGQGQSYAGGPGYTFQGNVSGNSQGSNPAHAISWSLPPRPPNVPTPPGIYVNAITATSAIVNVTASDPRGSNVVRYWQQIAPTPAFNSGVREWDGGSAQINSLSRATTYWTRSAALNAVGWSSWATTSFTTLATVPDKMAPPTVVTTNVDGATLSYTPPNNGGSAITSYGVQVARNSTFTDVVGLFPDGNITGLVPGTTYWARVRAGNAVGPGEFSDPVTFQTMAGIKVKIDGIWRNAKLWVKVAGNWVPAKVWKKNSSGEWVI